MSSDIEIVEDTFGFPPDEIESGEKSGKQLIRRFTLSNKSGMTVQIITYGATITSLKVPDKNGHIEDVVLGYDEIKGYLGAYGRNPYLGATIGRVANRTEKGKFTIGDKEYQLSINNGENHLHGGLKGFDKRLWESHVEGKRVTFSYLSVDGEEGYPGQVLAQVTFELTPDNQLHLEYQATTTKPTPINMTNHSYFNLSGHKKTDDELKGHYVLLNADYYTPVNDKLIPTREIKPVNDTVYDLRTNKNLHELLKQFPPGQYGYDTNFCINRNQGETIRLAGRVHDIDTGRVLEVYTDQPGLQFYTSNFLPGRDESPIPGKDGAKYFRHGAFCMETQNYPNAVNIPTFPDPVINPGTVYSHKAIFRFFTTPT